MTDVYLDYCPSTQHSIHILHKPTLSGLNRRHPDGGCTKMVCDFYPWWICFSIFLTNQIEKPTLYDTYEASLSEKLDYNCCRGMGVTSAWSPLGNFLEGQVHPDRRMFKDLWICAFYL